MKFVELVNRILRQEVKQAKNLVVYGQNINTGSCLGGLTKDLQVTPPSQIINTPNCENSLCGLGFGLMIQGCSALYCVKQLDFLMLGMDQLVNTWNALVDQPWNGSFTILTIIMDIPHQGPQSSFTEFEAFTNVLEASADCIEIEDREDANRVLSLVDESGFRIIGICQSLLQQEIPDA